MFSYAYPLILTDTFGDPTIDSSLSNLLKQFRADFTKLSREEIIFNPHHLLKMFTVYDAFYGRVATTDSELKKRNLFWLYLVGFVQRYLPANVAQIYASQSYYEISQNQRKNSRTFDSKRGCYSIFPLSFDSNSELGYTFTWATRIVLGRDAVPALLIAFQNLYRAKTANFQKLLRDFSASAGDHATV